MPGAARQQVTLFCIAQNTSNQTKGHPAAPALRAAFGLTAKLGGCATRPGRVHKPQPAAELEQCSPSSQFVRQTEAAQKGIWVLWARSRRCSPSPHPSPRWGEGVVSVVLIPSPSRGRSGWGWGVCFCPLAMPPSSTAGPGDVGEHCLSAQGEFRSRPASASSAGHPEGAVDGVAFFGYLSWRSKKGDQPPGCPRQSNTRAKRTKPNYKLTTPNPCIPQSFPLRVTNRKS